MEYAITAAVTLIFVLIYVLLKQPPRDTFFTRLRSADFQDSIKLFVDGQSAPKEGGATLETAYFARQIKSARRKLKRWQTKRAKSANTEEKSETCVAFPLGITLTPSNLKKIEKTDFAPLFDLPTLNNQPRIVSLMRQIMSTTAFSPSAEQIEYAFLYQTSVFPLSFAEIDNAPLAAKYVIFEKLGHISRNVNLLLKNSSSKYVKKTLEDVNSDLAEANVYKNSQLEHIIAQNKYLCSLQNTVQTLNQTIDDVTQIDYLDFYRPYALLKKYTAFALAKRETCTKYLALLSKVAQSEQLCDAVFAQKLDSYTQSHICKSAHRGIPLHARTHTSALNRTSIHIGIYKNDMCLLSAALTDDYLMQSIFGIRHKIDLKSLEKLKKDKNGQIKKPIKNQSYCLPKIDVAPPQKANIILENYVFESTFAKNNIKTAQIAPKCKELQSAQKLSVLSSQMQFASPDGCIVTPPDECEVYADDSVLQVRATSQTYTFRITHAFLTDFVDVEPLALSSDIALKVGDCVETFESKWFENPSRLGEYASHQSSAISKRLKKTMKLPCTSSKIEHFDEQFDCHTDKRCYGFDGITDNQRDEFDCNSGSQRTPAQQNTLICAQSLIETLRLVGLSILNDILFLSPQLPQAVSKMHLELSESLLCKKQCSIDLVLSDADRIYFGDTLVGGVDSIKIDNLPKKLVCHCGVAK